jgi:hypothetical protein
MAQLSLWHLLVAQIRMILILKLWSLLVHLVHQVQIREATAVQLFPHPQVLQVVLLAQAILTLGQGTLTQETIAP